MERGVKRATGATELVPERKLNLCLCAVFVVVVLCAACALCVREVFAHIIVYAVVVRQTKFPCVFLELSFGCERT